MKILGQKRNLKKEDLSGIFLFCRKVLLRKEKMRQADADICRGDLWLLKKQNKILFVRSLCKLPQKPRQFNRIML